MIIAIAVPDQFVDAELHFNYCMNMRLQNCLFVPLIYMYVIVIILPGNNVLVGGVVGGAVAMVIISAIVVIIIVLFSRARGKLFHCMVLNSHIAI